ncbi:citrate lyase acyl carrier protein [Lactobacillus sp. CC-MHH1034]|uniref:citrate lyase acyl carrier protein n=1 Tax=Agrilactobacillus fermenti TaxID=2586909 RepID=UPI001E2D8A08|nr:citrate lyase acyl carrier protein [Agrilactobacillus fermenti]MCD2257078.1 citrate lyase acyl carrier protein [Agrilactobacillus fermenti]
MRLQHQAIAGTTESSDIQIMIEPNVENEIAINLDSSVQFQFGKQIKQVIQDTLTKLGVTSANIKAIDRGALDCTVKARTLTAIYRAADVTDEIDWQVID